MEGVVTLRKKTPLEQYLEPCPKQTQNKRHVWEKKEEKFDLLVSFWSECIFCGEIKVGFPY